MKIDEISEQTKIEIEDQILALTVSIFEDMVDRYGESIRTSSVPIAKTILEFDKRMAEESNSESNPNALDESNIEGVIALSIWANLLAMMDASIKNMVDPGGSIH